LRSSGTSDHSASPVPSTTAKSLRAREGNSSAPVSVSVSSSSPEPTQEKKGLDFELDWAP
jgi:hypothetical protein